MAVEKIKSTFNSSKAAAALAARDAAKAAAGGSNQTVKNTGSSGGSVAVPSTPNTASTNSGAAAAQAATNAARSAASRSSGSSGGGASSTPAGSGYSAQAALAEQFNAAARAAGGQTGGSDVGMSMSVTPAGSPSSAAQPAQSASTGGTWVPLGTYNDKALRESGQADYIDQMQNAYTIAQQNYNAARMAGNTDSAAYWKSQMEKAHYNAELYRASQGYSGGDDGSDFIPRPQGTPASAWWPSDTQAQTSNPNYIDGVYVDPIDQDRLSGADLTALIQLKKEYATATPERRAAINQQANALRAPYGYSLGDNGATFSALPQEQDTMARQGLPAYQGQYDAVNSVYDRLNDATLSQLMASYNNSRAESEYQMGKISPLYQAQRNQVGAENELEKLAFRENAAASGMNAGNGSQAALAFSNQLQNDLGQLRTAEATALAQANHDLTQLYTEYQGKIAEAVAQNNFQRAAALLQEYQTAQQSRVDTAYKQAGLDLQIADFNRGTRQWNIQNQQNQEQLAMENLMRRLQFLMDSGDYTAVTQVGGNADLAHRYQQGSLGTTSPNSISVARMVGY